MIINAQIPLHRLVLSLSDGLDHVHPAVVDHQLRVAYISTNLARQLGIRGQELLDVFQAAALHDIGLIHMENRVLAVRHSVLEGLAWHAEAGYELLRDQELFANSAEIIRSHHAEWRHGCGTEHTEGRVPFASHIVALADTVERAIERDLPILEQAEFIAEKIAPLAGDHLHPDCVAAFQSIAHPEAFWLDCVSNRIYGILLEQMDWPLLTVDEDVVGGIAEAFARVVDATSHWTATHSAGVAAGAVALAERLGFSPREVTLMRAAGYLHDIGKLSVPPRILDKPGKPTAQEWAIIKGHTYHSFRILNTIGGMPQIREWAAFHHERIDGTGYPFRHAGRDLTLGSRIMAVADTFAAITEDRPYRKTMEPAEALSVMDRQVERGALDGDIVAALHRDHEAIRCTIQEERASYSQKQKDLIRIMKTPQAPQPQAI